MSLVKIYNQGSGGGGALTLVVGTTIIEDGSKNSILFQNKINDILDSSSVFVYDKVNNRLGVNIAIPTTTLQVNGFSTLQNIATTITNTYNIGSAALFYNFAHLLRVRTNNIRNISASNVIVFREASGVNIKGAFFTATQNLVIGSAVDSGYRIDLPPNIQNNFRSSGAVFVGSNPTTPSAILELSSTTQGFLLPKLSSTTIGETDSIDGMQVYDINKNEIRTRGFGFYDTVISPPYYAWVWNTKQNGTINSIAPANIFSLQAGLNETILFASTHTIKAGIGNIINVNLFFSATRAGGVNTVVRIFLASAPNFLSQFIQIGQFQITSAQFISGQNSVGYDVNYFIGESGATTRVRAQRFNNNLTNNNLSKRVLSVDASIGTLSVIGLPFVVITLDNEGILHNAKITFAN